MKTTIEIAKECGMTISGYNIHANLQATFYADIECLENFRKACEADFISRCERFNTATHRLELMPPLYTLPKE